MDRTPRLGRVDLVVLDLDGTLYHSTPTTLGAVERAVAALAEKHSIEIEQPSHEAILGGVGSTREEFPEKVVPSLAPRYHEELDRLIWFWEEELMKRGLGSIYPGGIEALEVMTSDGLLLAVASNAGSGYMRFVLERFKLGQYLRDARCAGDANVKGKGELLAQILDKLRVQADRSVMVGDRLSDIEAAREVGARSVGCTWGFGTADELARADRRIDRFAELPELLRAWP